MKNQKFTILLALLMFLSLGSFAQFAVNADIVIPTASASNVCLGASGTYLHGINDALFVGGNAGFRVMLIEDISVFQIPILANARYYINEANSGFYPEAFLGFAISHYSFKAGYWF